MKFLSTAALKKYERLLPIAIPLALIGATTAVLVALDVLLDTERLVFVYLVPTTLVAIVYGSLAGTLTAIASALCAAYFLYPPTFAIWIEDPRHNVELAIFAALALVASHIVGRLGGRG